MAKAQAEGAGVSVKALDRRGSETDTVNVPDSTSRRQQAIASALVENRRRRAEAAAEADAARAELVKLLGRGDAAGLSVSAMARAAGISRETAHRWLREVRGKESGDA
jgi:hypothetical protein